MAVKFPHIDLTARDLSSREDLRNAATGTQRNTGLGVGGSSLDLNLLGSAEGAQFGVFSGRDLNAEAIEYDPDLWDAGILANDKYLKPMFEGAKKALELHKANAIFIKQLYEMNKALMTAAIDPIFAAIDRILEEIIAILNSLRGLGFYMIQVTSTTVQQNVQKNPITGALHVGTQTFVPARMNAKGEYEKAIKDADGNYSSAKVIDSLTNEQIYVEYTPLSSREDPMTDFFSSIEASHKSNPKFGLTSGAKKAYQAAGSFLRGDVANEYYIQMNEWTGLTELTPMGILNTISESFDDKMDLPKHFKRMYIDGELESPELEDFATADPDSIFYKTTADKVIAAGKYAGMKVKDAYDTITDPSYYESGRPIFPASAQVAGMIFIIGAPDLAKFNTILDSFNKFISLDGLKDLSKSIKKITKPVKPQRTLRIKQVCNVNITKQRKKFQGAIDAGYGVDTVESQISQGGAKAIKVAEKTTDDDLQFNKEFDSAGAFNTQSLKKEKRIMNMDASKVARITKVVSTKQMYIPRPREGGADLDSWDMPLTESRIREMAKPATVNANKLPYNEQVLEVEMITNTGDFAPGDIVAECIPAPPSKLSTVDETSEGSTGSSPEVLEGAPNYAQIKDGRVTVGTVVQGWSMTAKGKPPNWRGQSMELMFPGLSQVFDRAEAEVRSMQSSVKTARKLLDPIIDFLDSKIDDAMVFAADIEKILDLFANGLPAAGTYSLYLPPQPGGIEKFRERMMAAGGEFKPPEDLKYCAGVCFLGGGPDNGLLIKSIDTLAMLLGMRHRKDSENEDIATMEAAATPPFDEEETYMAGDTLWYKAKNYDCLLDDTPGSEKPLHQVNGEGPYVLNSTYWKLAAVPLTKDEAVVPEGDPRTPAQLKADKIAWLTAAKGRLNEILGWLDGNNTLEGGQNMREQINAVSLFGKINLDGKFVGDNRNIYDELFQMRENDLRELELLVARVKEMISTIELMQIQASPGTPYDYEKNPEGVRNGSLRSKGTTLMIINGEFVDFVDDFDSGQRRIRENTTITIMDPTSDSSGSTRSIESLSNSTVAILDEPFPVDIDEALAYDIVLDKAEVPSDYMDPVTYPNSKFDTWVDATTTVAAHGIANTTHYLHPGYRVREYLAKANTISVIMPNGDEYDTLPVWTEAETHFTAGNPGSKRTVSEYAAGTIIKLNGFVPASEGFIMDPSTDENVEVFGTEQAKVASWMALGVSKDDKLTVDFGSDTEIECTILETIGDEYVAVNEPYRRSDNSDVEQFKYHENWKFEIAEASQKEKTYNDLVQQSRTKFLKYLEDINAKADNVYLDLQTLQDKTWPPVTVAKEAVDDEEETGDDEGGGSEGLDLDDSLGGFDFGSTSETG